MITLIHGDNTELSRSELQKLVHTFIGKDVRILDGKIIDETNLIQAVESNSLFSGSLVIVIEQLLSKNAKQIKKIERFTAILQKNSRNNDIILWEDKEIGAATLKLLGPSVQIQVYKFPVIIFQFLDSLSPNNAAQLVDIYAKLIERVPPEIVFAMFHRRIRQLIQLSDGVRPEDLSPWQINRLTTQLRSFTINELTHMYKKLHDIEVQIRTGTSAFTLSSHIELLLASFSSYGI